MLGRVSTYCLVDALAARSLPREPFSRPLGLRYMSKKILALPGSLRADSSSNAVLKIISANLPDHVTLEIFEGMEIFRTLTTRRLRHKQLWILSKKFERPVRY